MNASSENVYPCYLKLVRSGELKDRIRYAFELLNSCGLCPRKCKVNRLENESGFCKTGRYAVLGSYFPHHGEEDCIRGWRGSGTIFFSGCNLQCVFCQNWDISHFRTGERVESTRLAEVMLELQGLGCHNINLVTPTHVVPQILEALDIAAERGLRLPIVYNTGGYDALDTLKLMDGIVDIYMPDFKIWDPCTAKRLLHAEDYPEVARNAIKEMHRQVGNLVIDSHGLAKRGLLIRHLIMPSGLAGTREFSEWVVRELGKDTYINIMSQYHPDGLVLSQQYQGMYIDISRRITGQEYKLAVEGARSAGLYRFD